jgi:hypothetical protein
MSLTGIVILNQMEVGVIPDGFEIDTIVNKFNVILSGDKLISNLIGIIAIIYFLVIGVDLGNESEIESLLAKLEQTFIVRFDIHKQNN